MHVGHDEQYLSWHKDMIIYSLFHGASGYAILRTTKLKKTNRLCLRENASFARMPVSSWLQDQTSAGPCRPQ